MPQYKEVARVEGLSGNWPIGVKIEVAIGRELSTKEQIKVGNMAQELVNRLYDNSMRSDPETIKGVQKNKQDILACFPEPIYVKEIENEYNPGDINPWFLVTTKKGVIKIGWRKRVINIDWTESDITKNANALFLLEDTTKFDKTIHAWGYEKAKEYIQTLLNS